MIRVGDKVRVYMFEAIETVARIDDIWLFTEEHPAYPTKIKSVTLIESKNSIDFEKQLKVLIESV